MSMYEYIVFLKICLFERFAIILCNRFLLDICWTKNHTIHAACTENLHMLKQYQRKQRMERISTKLQDWWKPSLVVWNDGLHDMISILT